MNSIFDTLQELTRRAKAEPALAERILAVRRSAHPVDELCAISCEIGLPLYSMDLVMAGEEYYAAMRRSTNGGGENSPALPAEEDYFELFLTEVERSCR